MIKDDLVKYIINMAEQEEILSLRGTCLYILNMLCNTSSGRD